MALIKNIGNEYLNYGCWETLSRWLGLIPETLWQNDCELVLLWANSQIHLGDVAVAAQQLNKAISLANGRGDWLIQARALSWRSAAHRLTGNLFNASEDVKQAIQIFTDNNGPSDLMSEAYRRLGEVDKELGHFSEAAQSFHRALDFCANSFDLNCIADLHNSLGIVYGMMGNLTLAGTHFDNASRSWQKVNNQGAEAMALNNMANTYHKCGQYEMALNILQSGLEKARETGYLRIQACIILNIAEVLRDSGRNDDAIIRYKESLELARLAMEPYYATLAKGGLGETYRRIGDLNRSDVLLKEAICELEGCGKDYESILFRIGLGAVDCDRGDFGTATSNLGELCKKLEGFGDKDGLARGYFHLARTVD